MNSSSLKRLSTSILGATLLTLKVIAAAPAQATTLTGYSTCGGDMAGMLVTVNFLNGGSQTVPWGVTNSSTCGYSANGHPFGHYGGGAFGSGWSLTESDDTYGGGYESRYPNLDDWILTDSGSPITSLTINAILGNTVFDAITDGCSSCISEVTPGSADGYPFTVISGQVPDGYPFYVTSHKYPYPLPLSNPTPYSVPIDISKGDLFGTLSLSWSSGFTGTLKFLADTDSGSSSDPVKAAAPPNIPPTLSPFNDTIYEGQPAIITLSATDPSPDPINFLLNGAAIGTDGNTSGTRTASVNLGTSYVPGVYPLIGQAVNSQGGASNAVQGTLTVLDLPPTVTDFALNGSNSNITISEGQSVAAVLASTDPGVSDTATFTLINDNTGSVTTTPATPNPWTTSTNLGTFLKYGTYTYTAVATDNYNESSAPVTRTITVQNVPPTLTAFNLSSNTINEGQSASAILSATDPGADVISFLINGKSVGTDPTLSGTRSLGTSLGLFDIPGTYTFQAQAEDDGGAFSNIIPQTLTVKDVPPTITSVTVPLTVQTGNPFDISALATDPGSLPLTYDWDFSNNGLFTDLVGQSGQWTFSSGGTYTVGLKVADGYGGFAYRYFQIESVPEPSSIVGVLAFSVLSAGSLRKRKQQQKKQA